MPDGITSLLSKRAATIQLVRLNITLFKMERPFGHHTEPSRQCPIPNSTRSSKFPLLPPQVLSSALFPNTNTANTITSPALIPSFSGFPCLRRAADSPTSAQPIHLLTTGMSTQTKSCRRPPFPHPDSASVSRGAGGARVRDADKTITSFNEISTKKKHLMN